MTATLQSLFAQSILSDPRFSARIMILANGCTDNTAALATEQVAAAGLSDKIEVLDLSQGGKSRTWNAFVHELSRPDAAYLAFCDADIVLPQADTFAALVDMMIAEPTLHVVSSKPIKDIALKPENLSMTERLIATAGEGGQSWELSICGQLYITRSAAVRAFHLPIGLPVEDGFVRAMILTDLFEIPQDLSRISGKNAIYHVYESERSITALVRHQTRIVIGSAINAVVFGHLSAMEAPARRDVLAASAGSENWLSDFLKERLPNRKFGWVPWRFLTKRLVQAREHEGRISPKRMVLLGLGFCFDAVVYLNAQIKMARGVSAGFW